MNKILIILTSLFWMSCTSINCKELDGDFSNYEQAFSVIKSTNFNLSEELITSESSWILSAEYHSCDNEKGYLIINTKNHPYIHHNVPLKLWTQFKKANSFGEFYVSKIKGKYRLNTKG